MCLHEKVDVVINRIQTVLDDGVPRVPDRGVPGAEFAIWVLGLWFRCVVPKQGAHNKVANTTYLYPYLDQGDFISIAPPSRLWASDPSGGCSMRTAPVFASCNVTFASGYRS